MAGQLVAQTHPAAGDVLSPWQGFGVFCLWTVVLLALAGWLLQRRERLRRWRPAPLAWGSARRRG